MSLSEQRERLIDQRCRRGRRPVAAIAPRPHARRARPFGRSLSARRPALASSSRRDSSTPCRRSPSRGGLGRWRAAPPPAWTPFRPARTRRARTSPCPLRRLPPRRTPRRRVPRRSRSCPTSLRTASRAGQVGELLDDIGALELRPDDDPLERELQRHRRADAGKVLGERCGDLIGVRRLPARNTQSGSP